LRRSLHGGIEALCDGELGLGKRGKVGDHEQVLKLVVEHALKHLKRRLKKTLKGWKMRFE
jgi:hypothetical protein